ncbi:hypothetical protein M5K25_026382 [Dendrobium thyrsiflorum]|uniref:Uncharacterized protein n=1 Tax=Dendrobium thyrsiflorum TaxID=117978 RepID=A0ABD0TXA2_DENTH
MQSMMVVAMTGAVAVYYPSHMLELLHVARDRDRPLLLEPVYLLRLFEKPHEQRMVNVVHRNDKSLLLFPLAPNPNRHASFLHLCHWFQKGGIFEEKKKR